MSKYPAIIIDDDVWMQRILMKTLESFGFTPIVASNGFEGVAMALEAKPIIIFLDVLMPEISGLITLKMIKHIKAIKETPVVIVTASPDVENLTTAIKNGAADFISKPFTRGLIFDKLRDILSPELMAAIAREQKEATLRQQLNLKENEADTSSKEKKDDFLFSPDDPSLGTDPKTANKNRVLSELKASSQEEAMKASVPKPNIDAVKDFLQKKSNNS